MEGFWPNLLYNIASVHWSLRSFGSHHSETTVRLKVEKQRVSPCNPYKQAVNVQSFSNSTVTNCNILTEVCKVWGAAFGGSLQFLWALHQLTLGWLCLDVDALKDWQLSVNNLSQCKMMDFRFGNGLITLQWLTEFQGLNSISKWLTCQNHFTPISLRCSLCFGVKWLLLKTSA